MASAEERTIVLKAQNGDRFAFDQLYKLHNRRIQVIVSRRVRDPEDVKDLVQTVFIRAYEALPSFRGEAAYSTWLTRIALNVCNTHYQMQTSRRRMMDQAFLIYEALSILQEDPERITHRNQCHDLVCDLISTLPPNCRDVMWLRYVMDCSNSQIGSRLRLPMGTVKTWL